MIYFSTKTKFYKNKEAMRKGIAKMQKAGWKVEERGTVKRWFGRTKYKVYYSRHSNRE